MFRIYNVLSILTIDPSAVEDSFSRWIQELIPSLDKQIVPIDGQCWRGSYDREGGLKEPAIYGIKLLMKSSFICLLCQQTLRTLG